MIWLSVVVNVLMVYCGVRSYLRDECGWACAFAFNVGLNTHAILGRLLA